MILVKNRQLLFSEEERYLGTTYDENSTNRIFRLERINEDGKDLASLDYNIDLIYMKDLTTDTAQLEKTVDDRYVYLTWLVSDISFSKPGAIKINLRGKEASGIVKWSSFQDIVYIAETGSPITPPEGSLTELEQIENQMSALSTSLQNAESERVTAEQERETAEQGRAAAESERQYEFEQTMGEFDEDKAQLENWAKLSKSYAHGGSGVREGEDTDNSFYYMQQAGSQASAAATSASAAAQAKQDAEAAAEEAGEIASASIDNLTLKRNSAGVMYVDGNEVVVTDDTTIGKNEDGELESLVTAENFSVADKYGITEDEPTPAGTSTKKSFLQTMMDKLCNALVNTLVSTDSFQTVLKTYLANNGTTNVEGFGLDARYGKTLADQISSLNSNKANSQDPTLKWNGLSDGKAWLELRKSGTTGQDVSLVYNSGESGDANDLYTIWSALKGWFPVITEQLPMTHRIDGNETITIDYGAYGGSGLPVCLIGFAMRCPDIAAIVFADTWSAVAAPINLNNNPEFSCSDRVLTIKNTQNTGIHFVYWVIASTDV